MRKWGWWCLWCLTLAMGCLTAADARATDVSGSIGTQTWTLQGSPYVLTGDVTIPVGATLTVEAGVVVHPSPTDGLAAGNRPTRVELIVQGALDVNGTPESPVSFVPASPTGQNDWYGIYGSFGSSLEVAGALIKNAEVGILAGGTAMLSGLTIDGCETGIAVDNLAVTLEHSILTDNDTGLYSAHGFVVDHCTFDHNDIGIDYHAVSTGAFQVRNSLVTHSTTYGIRSTPGNFVYAQYTILFDGGIPNQALIIGLGTCNPILTDALRPTSHSPARNAASDGTDLGALAYDGDPTPGLYGVLFEDTTLDAAGSPYDIPGDLEVAPDATLTLAPGAVLRFAPNSDVMKCGDLPDKGELRARGNLNAVGTADAKISVSSTTPFVQWSWGGITLLSNASPSPLTNLEVSGGTDCISRPSGAPWTLSRSELHHCGAAVTSGVSVALDALTIHDSDRGVDLVEYGGPLAATVQNLVSYGNLRAIGADLTEASTLAITNLTSFGDQLGVSNLFAHVAISNSIFAGNSSPLTGAATVTHSNFWDYDNAPEVETDATLNVDPEFVNAPLDLHLRAGSPCIDTGSPAGAPAHDRDGTARPLDGDGSGSAQWDMGAYEAAASTSSGGGEGGVAGSDAGAGNGEAGGGVTPGTGGTGNVGSGGEEPTENGGQPSGAKGGHAGKGGEGARGGAAGGAAAGRGAGGSGTGGTRMVGGGSPATGGHDSHGNATGNQPPTDDSGCGCRTAPRRAPPVAPGFALLILFALGARTRRIHDERLVQMRVSERPSVDAVPPGE